jgi:hypothetical protein
MGFSINPLEFVKMMTERHKISRQQVIDWLECVRADGRLLSDTWMKIAGEFEKQGEEETLDRLLGELEMTRMEQEVLCSRLDGFFEYASLALGGRLQTRFWDGFINRLGGVLSARTKARSMTDRFLKEEKILVDSGDKSERVETISEAITALQKELGSLDVFIQTIKAAPNAIR